MKKHVVLMLTVFLLAFCVLLCACSDQPQKDKGNTEKAEQTYSSSENIENTTEPDTEASSDGEQTEDVQTENTQTEPPHTSHTYGEWSVKTAATCEGKGTKVRQCTVCGNTETEDIAPVGHSMGNWVITREPTCAVNGSQQRKCTVCGFTESAGIGKPHSYVSTVVPPTATEQGYTEHVCSGCQDTYRDTYTDPTGQPEPHVHSFGAYVVTTPAGCETAGVKTSTCAGCGETKTLSIDATGHSMGDWVITRQPTCNGGGMKKRECHNCNYYETVGIPVPHSYVSTVVPPTATEQGYTEHVCSSCGDTYKDNYTDPTGQPEPHVHSFEVYVVTTPASCDTAGEETSTCSCGEKNTRPIDAKGHNYGSTVVPPTTTEQGYTLYTCSVCGDSYKDNYTSATGSEGLSFSLSNDGTYYTLTGLGTCTDTDIVIPATYEGLPVTKISTYAFWNQVQIESVVIPEGIIEMGSSSFAGTWIKSVTLPSSLKTVTGFANCIKLTSVTISAGATSIGDNAFNGCTSLVSITIPEGVESIGYQSFANCGALSTVTLPSTLKTIGKSSFYFCSALKTLEIPSSVTLIDEFSFYKSGLETITIPDSVRNIGASAFRQCESLATVTLSKNISAIEAYVFYECVKLERIVIPDKVEIIKEYAFFECEALKDAILSSSLKEISHNAFNGCTSLLQIDLPLGLESIGNWAFWRCIALKSIVLPNSVTSLGDCVFDSCAGLESAVISSGISTIPSQTFLYCTSLKSVTIPSSITTVAHSAFGNCSALTDVYYNGSLEQWNNITIGMQNEFLTNATVHCKTVGTEVGNICSTVKFDLMGSRQTVYLENYRGRVVVLNFWFNTCPPCLSELPHFYDVAKEYSEDVTIAAIHVNLAGVDLESFVAANYPNWDGTMVVGWDTNAYCTDKFGISACPTTIIVDGDGIITDIIVGMMSRDELVAAIEKAM